jgi:hypothetical protein
MVAPKWRRNKAMIGIQHLLFPAITAALLVIIYRKAGLTRMWMLLPLLPLMFEFGLLVILNLQISGAIDPGRGSDLGPVQFILIGHMLSLLPLAVLAFVSWPIRNGRPLPPEVSK